MCSSLVSVVCSRVAAPLLAALQGTATAGADYAVVNMSVPWPAGQRAVNVSFAAALRDVVPESAETFTVSLCCATYAYVSPTANAATVTITAQDGVCAALLQCRTALTLTRTCLFP